MSVKVELENKEISILKDVRKLINFFEDLKNDTDKK